MLNAPAAKVRMVRVLTYGKGLEAIEQEAVSSVNKRQPGPRERRLRFGYPDRPARRPQSRRRRLG